MAGIKCIHYLKVCETIRGMTKYLSMCKGTMQHTISRQTRHQANDFLVIPKAEATIPLTEQMLGQIQRIDAVGGDDAEMADKVIHESMRSTTSRSRSRIQSTQSEFKLIRFNDGSRGQVGELVEDEDAIADVPDIPGDADNRLPFKKNVEYESARFMQAGKMTKGSMTMFFSNSILAPMREHLNYKNMDEMKALLTKLPYGKVIWWTRSLNIRSVTADVAPKEYLMYYLDIIPAIRFLIGHRRFAPYLAYAPV